MKLYNGATCINRGVIAHELFHALGVDHEQSRSDRDNFVTINWNNIESGKEDQFYIESTSSLLNTPYDVPKNPLVKLLDNRQNLSPMDVAGIRFLYKSTATC